MPDAVNIRCKELLLARAQYQAAPGIAFYGNGSPRHGAPAAACFGLVDALFPTERVEAGAVEKVSGLAFHSRAAFLEIKKNRVETIRGLYAQHHKAKNEAFVDCWFSDPVRPLLEAAARKF